MSESNIAENKIYEITRLMQSPDNLRNDMKEAMEIVAKHFRTKYIIPVEREIECCSEACKKAPLKEAVLLDACRPFVKNTETIDMFLNILNGINIINNIVPKKIKAAEVGDSSIHSDGIYDIDESCKNDSLKIESLFGTNPIVIILLLIILAN